MSFADRFVEHYTGRRQVQQEEFDIAVDIQESRRPVPYTIQNEFILRVELGVQYHANDAEHQHARANAIRMIVHEIYSDLHPHIRRIIGAAHSRDFKSVLESAHALLSEIDPK